MYGLVDYAWIIEQRRNVKVVVIKYVIKYDDESAKKRTKL